MIEVLACAVWHARGHISLPLPLLPFSKLSVSFSVKEALIKERTFW